MQGRTKMWAKEAGPIVWCRTRQLPTLTRLEGPKRCSVLSPVKRLCTTNTNQPTHPLYGAACANCKLVKLEAPDFWFSQQCSRSTIRKGTTHFSRK